MNINETGQVLSFLNTKI